MSLEPTFGDLANISVFVLTIAASLYYFGKLIAGVRVEQYAKEDYYIQGLVFSLMYVVVPFLVVLLIVGSLKLYFPIWISVFFQIVIMIFLSMVLQFNLAKYSLFSQFKPALQKGFDERKKKSSILVFADETMTKFTKKNLAENYFAIQEAFAKYIVNYYTLFLLSIILVWSIYSTLLLQQLLDPPSIFISILTFINFTFLALGYGYVNIYYPPARIILEDGKDLTGKILKIGKFVHIVKDDEGKKLFINASKIMYVEESMFKENNKQEDS